LAVAVAFAFLAACGFASGNVLVRVGTQKVPAPTTALLTVLSGVVMGPDPELGRHQIPVS